MSAKLYGTPGSPESYQLRDFLQRSNYPFTWVELGTHQEAQHLLGMDLNDPRLPVCVLPGGTTLYRPTAHELARALEWFNKPKHSLYDLAIYGAGPAGLSAAVYGASEGLRTILIEKSAIGGQAASTSRIENYLGFPEGISGWELTSRARQQATRLGAEIIVTGEAIGGDVKDGYPVGVLASGDQVVSRAVIVATGVEYRRLDLLNEERFLNRGLFYGAGSSEAALCRGDVFIVGGGNSAGQAALHLAQHANTVNLLVRGASLKSTLSTYLIERIEQSPNIRVLTDSTLTALAGEAALERVSYKNSRTGETTSATTSWVFICIGGEPRTDWSSKGNLQLDSAGYIRTGPAIDLSINARSPWPLSRAPGFLETSIPSIFAAGDVRHSSIKRCATAVGEGATAVSIVHQYLATL